MTASDEVTQWIARLSDDDQRAAELIWREYFEKLVRFARRKLEEMPRRAADEEDVALSAMHSLYRGLRAGRFPELNDREDLWKVLVTIAARKACAQRRRDYAAKRGGGRVRGESALAPGGPEQDGIAGIGAVMGGEPTPEFARMVAESYEHLLASLEDEGLRQVALCKLEGYTNEEIAAKLGCATRSVVRKLARIRTKWSREAEP